MENKPERLRDLNIWEKVEEEFDGIYYINSWELHSMTYFNVWDCDSIALFNAKNMELLNPRLGKVNNEKKKGNN